MYQLYTPPLDGAEETTEDFETAEECLDAYNDLIDYLTTYCIEHDVSKIEVLKDDVKITLEQLKAEV